MPEDWVAGGGVDSAAKSVVGEFMGIDVEAKPPATS